MHSPGVLILLELGMGTEGFKDSLFTGEFKTQEQEFTTQEEKKKKESGPNDQLSKSAKISKTKCLCVGGV